MIHHRSGDFVTPASKDHYAPDLRVRPVHLDLDLRVDVEGQTLDGVVTHTLVGRGGADALTLHAVDFHEVRVEGDGVRYEYDGESLQLAWDEAFTEAEERKVVIRYRVREPRTGLMFSGAAGTDDPDRPLFAATDHETERARFWLPTVDLPAVRPTLSFHIRADARFTILANGRLERIETHDDGTHTAHWELEQPCPSYLTCFAIGEFAEWRDDTGIVPIAAYAPRSLYGADDLRRSFDRTKAMLDWMPEKLGVPFPYPKYYQFAAPFVGGAMENISLVSWDDAFVLTEARAPEMKRLVDIVNLHEMAHTWFGDHIVCRDYAHAWLKESWATYMESCWYEHDAGADEFAYDLYTSAANYFDECAKRYVRPIVTRKFDSSWDMYDYHLYPGGAWRLHMLRRLLGDAVFWGAVRTYLQRHAGGEVETDDFRRALEEASGRSLEPFFDQWLRRPGHPKLSGSFRWNAADREGVFELKQTQENEKKGVGLFDFDVDLAWWTGGERQVVTTRFEGRTLRHVIPMKTAPDRVRVDPDQKVLMLLDFDPGSVRLLRQLESDDVVGRILAGNRLIKSGKRSDLDAVARAYETDPFWGTRVQWAAALGNAKSEAAIEALADLASSQTEIESLAPLFRACGSYRDPRLAEVLQERLRGALPVRAREAALEALGKQRDGSTMESLVKASHDDDEYAAVGALRGLGESRQREALAPLTQALAGGRRARVRPAAATALGVLARHLDEPQRIEALDALSEALRDPIGRVRAAAAAALSTTRAHDRIDELEAYRARLPHQEQVRLDRHLRRLRGGPGPNKTQRRVEELEQILRKLESRLEKMEKSDAS